MLQGDTNKQVVIITERKRNERLICEVSKQGEDGVTGLDISQGKTGAGVLGKSESLSKAQEGATVWGMWGPCRTVFCFSAQKVKEVTRNTELSPVHRWPMCPVKVLLLGVREPLRGLKQVTLVFKVKGYRLE